MNPILALRTKASLTQRELAVAGGTSQPTIAAYESGRKSPSVATVQRLAAGVGFEVWIEYHPSMTREERRSLAVHRAIAQRLAGEPGPTVRVAKANLKRMRSRTQSQLLDEWEVLLTRPVPALLPVLTDLDPWARELRHVTPFAGVLSAGERTEVYTVFARDELLAS